jgi:O-antigen/teichoic acid export membrane protein
MTPDDEYVLRTPRRSGEMCGVWTFAMVDADPSRFGSLGRLRFLLRDSLLYGGASVVGRITTLVTLPVILRTLSVPEYGLLDFLQVFGAFLVILFVFGQESAVSRYFFEYEDVETRRRLISQSFVFRMAVTLLLLPVVWFFLPYVLRFEWAGTDPVYLFRIALFQLPFMILVNFSISILRITFSRLRFVALSVGHSFVQAGLWLYAILVLDLRVEGVMYGSLLSSAIFGLIGVFLVRSWLIIPTDARLLKEMLPYAIPFGAVVCLEAANPLFERGLIKFLLDADALGLYAAGAKVAMLFTIMAFAFQVAWNPFALAIHKSADAGRTYDQVLRLFALLVCLVALGIGAFAEPLVRIVGSDRFSDAAPVVFPLVMSLGIIALCWIFEIGINVSKRVGFKLIIYALAATTTFAGIAALTPILGILGASLGVLAGAVARVVATVVLSQRLHPLPWSLPSVVLLVGATLVLGLAGTVVGQIGGANWTMVTSLAACLAVLGLSLKVLLTPEEWQAVLSRKWVYR